MAPVDSGPPVWYRGDFKTAFANSSTLALLELYLFAVDIIGFGYLLFTSPFFHIFTIHFETFAWLVSLQAPLHITLYILYTVFQERRYLDLGTSYKLMRETMNLLQKYYFTKQH